ncbi:MAG TPA: outer membrane beta-barrel protein [Bacteroidales bacterium]|nr:outer membrane beta-barrel protein [Bacteroidales bacterium]HPT02670.1 outer membrane beta-barrel protein [Bacteroidales bacterium]
MKRIAVVVFLSLFSVAAFSQKPSVESITKRFRLSWEPFNDIWMDVPDSINPRTINQGVNIYGLYMFPMDRKDHISFFVGAGIGAHNFFHNALIGLNDGGITYLYNLPDTLGGTTIDVKKSKISVTYFDVPFGFKYKMKNDMHLTLGFKVGWKINDHWKYKGDCYEADNVLYATGATIKRKYSRVPNIDNFHYGPYISFGYKWFGIMANYQISTLFEKDYGPEVYPISVGLTFMPFGSK